MSGQKFGHRLHILLALNVVWRVNNVMSTVRIGKMEFLIEAQSKTAKR